MHQAFPGKALGTAVVCKARLDRVAEGTDQEGPLCLWGRQAPWTVATCDMRCHRGEEDRPRSRGGSREFGPAGAREASQKRWHLLSGLEREFQCHCPCRSHSRGLL